MNSCGTEPKAFLRSSQAATQVFRLAATQEANSLPDVFIRAIGLQLPRASRSSFLWNRMVLDFFHSPGILLSSLHLLKRAVRMWQNGSNFFQWRYRILSAPWAVLLHLFSFAHASSGVKGSSRGLGHDSSSAVPAGSSGNDVGDSGVKWLISRSWSILHGGAWFLIDGPECATLVVSVQLLDSGGFLGLRSRWG